MKSKQEIKEWILKNCVNEKGDLELSGLDFSDFNGDVFINELKIKRNLHQNYQEVGEDLIQDSQEVRGRLYQGEQEVDEDLIQNNQIVEGNLFQYNQKVGGELYQDNEEENNEK